MKPRHVKRLVNVVALTVFCVLAWRVATPVKPSPSWTLSPFTPNPSTVQSVQRPKPWNAASTTLENKQRYTETLQLVVPPVPIFGDMPEYLWPSSVNLTSEVTVSDQSSPLREDRRDDLMRPSSPVRLDYPCTVEKNTILDSKPVLLFVPWTPPTSNSPYPLQCPVKCDLTSDVKRIRDVEGYVVDTNGALINEPYHWPTNPLRKVLVLFNTENVEGRQTVLKKSYGLRYLAKPYNHSLWDQFHLVISYHWFSPIRLSYFEWASCRSNEAVVTQQHLKALGKASGTLAGKDPSAAPVLFFARNCDWVLHKRQGFVRALMKHLSVDAVGKCLNNREQTSYPSCSGLKLKNRRFCIIAQHKFYLSIENSISLDYVTEKVYEPLLVGTIPVYLGAPNAVNFLPTSHSAIIATDFTSVEALARYMKCVLRNESLYHYYTSWRQRPLLPTFAEIQTQWAPLCQACMRIRLQNLTAASSVGYGRPRVSKGELHSARVAQRPFSWCAKPGDLHSL